ncbi:MAG TPA: hypothetical protein VGM91_14040 [Conexibacter sp.]|jgi:hypothetical protein
MLAFLVYAAETGNKTPFYIVGAIFVIWALAIGGIGTLRPSFASGAGSSRLIMAGTVVLALVTMAMAVVTSS